MGNKYRSFKCIAKSTAFEKRNIDIKLKYDTYVLIFLGGSYSMEHIANSKNKYFSPDNDFF